MKTPLFFSNLYNLERQDPRSTDFDLNEYKKFLNEFGNPHSNIGKIIHIAGTNGKGSVAEIIASSLFQCYYKVGVYTSPHLYEINERIKIDGMNIDDVDFVILEKLVYDRIKNKKKHYRTFFEAMTTVAFLHFAMNKTDYVIIETGLGGRLDATNVVDPYLTVITVIDFDHIKMLGDSLDDIAREKGGIIKENIPLFTFKQNEAVNNVLKNICLEKNAPLNITDIENVDVQENSMVYKKHTYSLEQPGTYQKHNAALSIDVLDHIGIDEKCKKFGISNFSIKGRMETINDTPLIIVDGSHNPGAIKITLKEIREMYPNKTLSTLSVFMHDKNIYSMIDILKQYSENVMLSTIPFFRAACINDYAHVEGISYFDSTYDSIEHFYEYADKDDMLLIIGSFYLIEHAYNDVKEIFK